MLTYIQDSNEKNAVDEATKEAAKEATEKAMQYSKAMDILELLEEYGQVSDRLRRQICAEKNMETLRVWHKLAAKAESIEEFEEKMGAAANVS